jgi:DNA-binding NarL/FixJ family response regulator
MTATVLVVDDDELFRTVLNSMILAQAPRATVLVAEDLREGFAKFRLGSPSLVVVDIGLPDGNGLELVEHIKSHSPATVVAVCTSYDIEEYRSAAQRHGAEHFIAKSELRPEQIPSMVASLAEKTKGATVFAAAGLAPMLG